MSVPRCLLIPLAALGACAAEPPAPSGPRQAAARYEPAPMPFVRPVSRGGTVGALEIPLPPKMPLGTGVVPVSGSAVRGSFVTGIRRGF